jgi:hypothetical protein
MYRYMGRRDAEREKGEVNQSYTWVGSVGVLDGAFLGTRVYFSPKNMCIYNNLRE